MFAIKLADDAELRPLEPWQAEEYLAHMDRARALVDPWIPWAAKSKDLESARATLQDYATKQATDTGRIFGIWRDGTLVGGCLFVQFDAVAGNCEIGVWTEPAGEGRGQMAQLSIYVGQQVGCRSLGVRRIDGFLVRNRRFSVK